MSDDLKKLCVDLADRVLARDVRIADLERELAEARRVVGGEELVEIAAKAIWEANEGIPRLLYETGKIGTNLRQQQDKCRKQARAVIAAIAPSIASAEREWCAGIADAIANIVAQPGRDDEWQDGVKACAEEVAATIRARAQEAK